MKERIQKSDAEWREKLTPEQYKVTRQHGTERAGTSPLNHEKREGVFTCVCCGEPLFSSEAKFESGSRLAELLQADRRRCRDRARGPLVHDAPDRGALRALRCPSWPCVSGWPAARQACAIA